MPETESTPPSEATKTPKEESFFREVVKFSLIAILIVLPIRIYIAQPFIVSGASMQPNFQTGQYLIVDQLSYNFEAPKRGEVIIFKYPRDPSKFFIKRVIGLPGETVRIDGSQVIIANEDVLGGFVLKEIYLDESNRESGTVTTVLGPREYFVLGDNRRSSSDSRVWGVLNEDFIVGRAFLRLFPLTKAEILPSDFSNK